MKKWLRTFAGDAKGSVLILVAIGITTLVAIGGASIDLGIQQLMRAKMQNAADMAATSAAALHSSDDEIIINDQARSVAALRYFNLNYPSEFYNQQRPVPAINVTASTVQVTANGAVPTAFVNNFGITTLAANANSIATYMTAGRQQNSDVVLALDMSGSMSSNDAGSFGAGYTRIQALKDNAKIFIDNMLASGDNRIAIIKWDSIIHGTMQFSNDPLALKAYIDTLEPMGGTNSTVALEVAQNMPFRSNVVHAVILMTDGANSQMGPGYYSAGCNQSSLNICTAIKNTNARMYTIAFGKELAIGCKSLQPPGTPATPPDLPQQFPDKAFWMCASDMATPAVPWQHYCRPHDATNMTPWPPYSGSATAGRGPFLSNDPLNCPKPFLQQCASAPDTFFEAPDGAALAAAFGAIATNIQAIRIIE